MKVLEVKSLPLEGVKVLRLARFRDERGYFVEHFRQSDFARDPQLGFLREARLLQCNESHSKAGVIRGLHFQWNPFQGKLVRTVMGRMVDLVLDIRKGSPTFGQIVAYDLPADLAAPFQEWIWVPPGFAHGTLFTEPGVIEYFCSGEYSPGCEAGISPAAPDLDWRLCDPVLKRLFDTTAASGPVLSEKDRNGCTLEQWRQDSRSDQFLFGPL